MAKPVWLAQASFIIRMYRGSNIRNDITPPGSICADRGNNGSEKVLVAKVVFLICYWLRLRHSLIFGSKVDEFICVEKKGDPNPILPCNLCYRITE